MQGFWAHTYYDVLKTLQDSKTALISQFWSVMVLSVGSLMPSVMQSHMGFIVTSFTWYVMGQVMQSIEGLKTSWLWLSNTYFMETLTISIYPPPHPHLSPRPTPLPPSPQQTLTKLFQSKCLFRVSDWVNDLSHCPHGCNFSPVWMSKWMLMLPVCQNAFLHSVQLCGFAPLWCACSNSQPLCVTLRAGHKDEASPHCKWVNEFSDVQNAEQFFALSASVWLFLDCGRSCASSYLQYN